MKPCQSDRPAILVRALLPVLAAASLVGIVPAVAQEEARELSEVIVTAQRREEDIQKTPIAVTAISSETLADRALDNASELDRYVPNLQTSPTAAGTRSAASYNIRGIGQIDFINTTEPGVAVYLDGVYLARVAGAAIELSDIERIEVLRGPQGTLFGRNATAGALNIVTVSPRFDGFSGGLDVNVGSYTEEWRGYYSARMSANLPFTDKLAARVNLLGRLSDGWGENHAPGRGEGLGEEDTLAGRVSLLYKPSDRLDINVSADASRLRGTSMPMAGIRGPAITTENPLDLALSAPLPDDLDVFGVTLAINARLTENASFRSITAYREQNGEMGQDTDGSNIALLDQLVIADQDQLSQELHLYGMAFADRLQWLLGGYYFREDGTWLTRATLAFMPANIDTFNSTKSHALFTNLSFAVTDAFHVIAGARYTHEKKTLDAETEFGGVTLVPRSVLEKRFSAVSSKVGFEIIPTDNLMIYGSYTEGFRSGGFNGRPFALIDLTPFDEETNSSYELGVKADLLERTLRINAAAFISKYKDIQLTAIREDPVVGVAVLTANAGKADLPGFELEAQWLATTQLDIFASVGFLDNDGVRAKESFTIPGDTLPLSSRFNFTAGFDYRFGLSWLVAQVGLDVNRRTRYYHMIDNSPVTEEDGYWLLNARLKLTPADSERWDLLVYGKNLTNEVYRVFGQDSPSFGAAVVTLGPTREIGATVRFHF